jgi:hypothetical protein
MMTVIADAGIGVDLYHRQAGRLQMVENGQYSLMVVFEALIDGLFGVVLSVPF